MLLNSNFGPEVFRMDSILEENLGVELSFFPVSRSESDLLA